MLHKQFDWGLNMQTHEPVGAAVFQATTPSYPRHMPASWVLVCFTRGYCYVTSLELSIFHPSFWSAWIPGVCHHGACPSPQVCCNASVVDSPSSALDLALTTGCWLLQASPIHPAFCGNFLCTPPKIEYALPDPTLTAAPFCT